MGYMMVKMVNATEDAIIAYGKNGGANRTSPRELTHDEIALLYANADIVDGCENSRNETNVNWNMDIPYERKMAAIVTHDDFFVRSVPLWHDEHGNVWTQRRYVRSVYRRQMLP